RVDDGGPPREGQTPSPGRVYLRCGDGHAGWPEAAPFDRVLVAAAPEVLPQALVQQLADGGILIAPVGGDHQELVRVTRNGREVTTQSLLPVRFVPMTHR